IGYKPVKMAEFEAALAMMKDLMNGRAVEWNGKELELTWAKGRPEIPLYVAAYGPRALGVAGRVGDGVIIQLADPAIIEWTMATAPRPAAEAGRGAAGGGGAGVIIQLAAPAIIEWTMATARRAAEEAGRDPAALKCLVCAPSKVSDDLQQARDEVRWF